MKQANKTRLAIGNAKGKKVINVPLRLRNMTDTSDETAFSCTANYPQDVLKLRSVIPGPEIKASESEALNTNLNQRGKIGLLIDGVGDLIGQGREGVVAIFRFDVLPGAPKGKYDIFFDNSPTPCSVSTAKGVLLPCDYITGSATIT